jgi:hypothetical protein
MTALLKFLVILAIFLLACYANSFLSLSQVAGNQVQVNSLIWFEESNIQNRNFNQEPTNDQTINEVQASSTPNTSYIFEAVNGVSHIHNKDIVNKQETCSDNLDYEIHNKRPVECNSQLSKWQMTDKINLDSSGLQRSVWSAVLSQQEKVHSHFAMVLKSVKQSSTYTCLVLFTSFYAIGAELKCGVHSHWVFVKSSSKQAEGNASTQPCGLWHNKNSEQVTGNASSHPGGLCHDKKSEQAGGKASSQGAHTAISCNKLSRLIVYSNSEGAQFAPMITASVKAASTFFNLEFKLVVKSAFDALRSE